MVAGTTCQIPYPSTSPATFCLCTWACIYTCCCMMLFLRLKQVLNWLAFMNTHFHDFDSSPDLWHLMLCHIYLNLMCTHTLKDKDNTFGCNVQFLKFIQQYYNLFYFSLFPIWISKPLHLTSRCLPLCGPVNNFLVTLEANGILYIGTITECCILPCQIVLQPACFCDVQHKV